jgi:exopolysaccharide biosynthesis polyprenyl glycosylphosphotransferase
VSIEEPQLTRIRTSAILPASPATGVILRSNRRRVVSVGEALLVWAVLLIDIWYSNSLAQAVVASVLLAGVWVLCVRSLRRSFAHLEVVGSLLVDVIAAAGATLVLTALAGVWGLGDPQVIVVGVAAFVVTAAWTALGNAFSADAHRVLVVGGRADGVQDLLRSLRSDQRARFVPVGVVAEDLPETDFGTVPVVGVVADLRDAVHAYRPDLVVVGVQRNRPEVFTELLEVAESGFRVVGLPEFYEYAFGRLPIRHLTAAWFMSTIHLYQRPYSAFSKRVFDVASTLLILVLFAPLFPLLLLMVSLSPGSAIYRQTRIGEHGRPFTIFKFRTMTVDAEQRGSPVWAAQEDPRVTRIGRILRLSRLDELPQLLNVLRGDMSMVGPRPERPEFVSMLEHAIPFWSRRHLLKPGITGWAQVRSGYASDALATEEKLAYDLWYLRHRSIIVDLVICLLTLPRILTGGGAR